MQFPDEDLVPHKRGVSIGIRKENIFYRMDEAFSQEAVAKFVDDYVKGSLKVRLPP